MTGLEPRVASIGSPASALRLRALTDLTHSALADAASFADLLQRMDDAVVLLDAAFRIVGVNPAAERIRGRPADALIGQPIWDVWPGIAGTHVETFCRRLMDTRAQAVLEHFDTGLQRSRWLELRGYPTGSGGIAIVAREITGRRAVEQRLSLSEESLRLATDAAGVGIWDLDLTTNVLTWSDRTRAAFGMSPGAHCTLQDFYAGLHPDDLAETAEAFASALDPLRRAMYDVEYRTVGKEDGVVRWVAARGRGLFDAQGVCVRAIGTAIDITGRKAAEARLLHSEAALAESEGRLRAITDSIDQMIWSARADGRHDFYNQRWYDYTGITPGRMDGEGWHGLFHPDDREQAWSRWRKSLATGEPYETEYRLRHRSGIYRWVLGRAVPQRDETGRIVRWFGTCTDIEEIVRARDVLSRTREELEREVADRTRERDRTWRNTQDLLLVIDRDGIFREVNPAWTVVLGWETVELVGRHYSDFIHPDFLDETQTAFEISRDEFLPAHENRYRHKDGTFRWIEWVASPEGDMVYASGRHVTAEKDAHARLEAAQEQLRQVQKMEAVGQLTGGIAHDFNNLLQIIVGNLEILQRNLAEDPPRLRRAADNAMTGARRAATLTQRLLAFSRRQPLSPRPIDANALIDGMLDLLARALGETIELRTVLAASLWGTEADAHQLESAILNLAVNARDAMPDGGKLTIETANATLDEVYARANADVRPGRYVMIAVTDTGEGMDRPTIARAFEPFFTTKDVGKGTGLGLAMVYGFVKQSGGHIKLYSEIGQGTTVKVYLPQVQAPVVAGAQPDQPALPGSTTAETVLVVEDDEDVRTCSVEVLRELGYKVLAAPDGPAALRLLAAPDSAGVRLLFTDVVLPGGMTGADLARAAREIRTGLKVLFTTGYARNAIVHQGRLDEGVSLLVKPFTYADLAARIRDILDQ